MTCDCEKCKRGPEWGALEIHLTEKSLPEHDYHYDLYEIITDANDLWIEPIRFVDGKFLRRVYSFENDFAYPIWEEASRTQVYAWCEIHFPQSIIEDCFNWYFERRGEEIGKEHKTD